jgi:hypothetical protein
MLLQHELSIMFFLTSFPKFSHKLFLNLLKAPLLGGRGIHGELWKLQN